MISAPAFAQRTLVAVGRVSEGPHPSRHCAGDSRWRVLDDRDARRLGRAAAVTPAARELEQAGYELLHPPREEP
ncbi:MAG TPA: hypothetical protein VIJ50_12355 [Solirubrobacteraceae bacterium]